MITLSEGTLLLDITPHHLTISGECYVYTIKYKNIKLSVWNSD